LGTIFDQSADTFSNSNELQNPTVDGGNGKAQRRALFNEGD
jgi:hypothetical protein